MIYLLRVRGDSMSPTLADGQVVLAVSPRLARVRAGRVVAFRREGSLYLKRALSREGGGWYVVGDQPSRSTDSRRFGAVPEVSISAVGVLRLWPPGRL